jgi:lipopolysaccharide export system permease protein
MGILHRYILRQLLSNLAFSLIVFISLFLIFDFFDRIDNIIAEEASISVTVQYFVFKIPLIVSLMLPVAILVATLFTIGLLSKNSEVTAMRASGVTVWWIALPVISVGIVLSFVALLLNETIVPYAQRRVREIYNIDIRKKDLRGGYSQSDIWWRDGSRFFSVDVFDSRSSTLLGLSVIEIDDAFQITGRTDALTAKYLDEHLGWSMQNAQVITFPKAISPAIKNYPALPLPISKRPEDLYDAETDPHTMSYGQLKRFIKTQQQNGLSIAQYLADLYDKLAAPFFSAIVVLVVLPFSLKPARSGQMTRSILAALIIGFSYYAVHSFSIALGRAELLSPLLSAWVGNILLGSIGLLLLNGAETPQ